MDMWVLFTVCTYIPVRATYVGKITVYVCSHSREQGILQPRTQALLPTPGAAAKTLASFGHVSPRIWEITKENIQGRAVGNIC